MNTSTSSIGEMLNQSIVVLTKPGVSTFEQYERRGTMRDGLIYVAVAAAIAGLVAFVFGVFGGIMSALGALIGAILTPVVSYFIFAYVLYFMGKQQGGTGTQDEVFYSTALYVAPLLAITGAISNIPLINCLFLPFALVIWIYQLYLGYLASRASMNIGQNAAIISVVVAILAQIVVGWVIVDALVGAIFASGRV